MARRGSGWIPVHKQSDAAMPATASMRVEKSRVRTYRAHRPPLPAGMSLARRHKGSQKDPRPFFTFAITTSKFLLARSNHHANS